MKKEVVDMRGIAVNNAMLAKWKEQLRFDKRIYVNPKWGRFYEEGMVIVGYVAWKENGEKLCSGDGATYLACQIFRWVREHIRGKQILKYEFDFPNSLWLLVKTENARIYMLYITQKNMPLETIENFLKEVVPC
ncbi:MAG: hypothetical protein QXT86_12640 [Archaeoglobaceae archaeon]